MSDFMRVILLQDYNTRVVVFGVTCLGIAAGMIGTFLLLRKRSLTADALSHATLPGIAMAFILATAFGMEGKALPVLLTGAFVFGLLGVGTILLIRNTTRIKDDAALGIVLSVFFGLGMSLVKMAESMNANAAGLDRFMLGRAASMLASDSYTILAVGLVVGTICILLFKEFKMLCFDQGFASSQGMKVVLLDSLLMGLVVAVTVIGLQAVGLVLIIALLITPAAAARFWTDRLFVMMMISAFIGGISGYFGAIASALVDHLPTGPIIVLVCAAVFLLSLTFGLERGLVVRMRRHITLTRAIGLQHLLRAIYEVGETHLANSVTTPNVDIPAVDLESIRTRRSWSDSQLLRLIARAKRQGMVQPNSTNTLTLTLTASGLSRARQVVRNHRLWEMYLITYADIAPSHVDRGADDIEHILHADMIEELEGLLAQQAIGDSLPHSPHSLISNHCSTTTLLDPTEEGTPA